MNKQDDVKSAEEIAKETVNKIVEEQNKMLELGAYGGSNPLIFRHLVSDIIPRHFTHAITQAVEAEREETKDKCKVIANTMTRKWRSENREVTEEASIMAQDIGRAIMKFEKRSIKDYGV